MTQITLGIPKLHHREGRVMIAPWRSVLAAAGLLTCATVAEAGVITLDPGGAWGWDFDAIGGGQMHVCTVNCISPIAGPAFYAAGHDTGTFGFGPADFIAGPETAGGVFPVNATETFAYMSIPQGTHNNALDGVVTWAEVDDAFPFAILRGSLQITNSSGDPGFLADFPAGSQADVRALDQLACSLTDLVNDRCASATEETPMAGGSVTPNRVPVPEPPGLAILAMAIFAWATWPRRRTEA